MKLLYVLFILFIFPSCSFDNKTGIWENDDISSKKNSQIFDDFKSISNDESSFNEVVQLKTNYSFKIPKKIYNKKWEDIYFNQFNNYVNFAYNESKNLIFKSKKISKYNLKKYFLYDQENLILTDDKGNLIIFSINENQVIKKFNFYKKKYKKIKKDLNIIIHESIIYVTDNIGYIYAIDYKKNKILWAKNIKIPFRSNLKITNNKIIAADENNIIYLFDKNNGNLLKLLPTEETLIKNNFKSNFTLDKETIFMLNTYGSLYSINNKSNNIKWVVNLNQSLDVNPSNLFNGHTLVSNEKFIVVSSQDSTFIINSKNGSIISKFNIISKTKPLIIGNNLFLLSSNNLFISIDLETSEIIYSFKINKKMAEFLNIKEKLAIFEDIIVANNKILILLKNSYLAEFELTGELKNIFKLPTKIDSNLIFINNSILYLNHNNQLIVLG